ncbi:uncharacterized protein BYT42DRAFT_617151 [Radiomyces spectabilis]|uniref:uncharacterized protein n=1 Tax=Radiomyces spectabilis TaxID=64574 RepID=UPI00221FA7A5|nr:uncharacterized protein BYT42DRAFT_617151 [Radiomyces spectabilis]KAI8370614.1 hypothetical protein BYT42DRAFT_617151 [Radiomyces spectabilis]
MDDSTAWFSGPIAEAVTVVNTKNLPLVVYIHDDTDASTSMTQCLADAAVVEALASKTVALRFHKDSDNATLFGQLYPVTLVPIIYFIQQGTIKDFGTHTISPLEVVTKINNLHSAMPVEQSSSSSTATAEPSMRAAEPFTQVSGLSPASTTAAAEPTRSSVDPSPASLSSPESNIDNKRNLQEYKDKARKQREESEKQREYEQELKRREQGKQQQQFAESWKERQDKQYFENIKQEKKQEEEYRKKIREQIAKDKAERAQTRQQTTPSNQPSVTTQDKPRASSSHRRYDESHLSVRQLDGNRTDGDQPYKLIAQFPTRHFSITDEQRTLRELGLCPSATIIMKAIKNISTAYGGAESSGNGLLGYIYSAGGLLYNAVSTVGSTVTETVTSYMTSPTDGNNGLQVNGGGGQRLGGGESSSTRPYKRYPGSNVNTLRTTENEDPRDREGMYNGNSINQE